MNELRYNKRSFLKVLEILEETDSYDESISWKEVKKTIKTRYYWAGKNKIFRFGGYSKTWEYKNRWQNDKEWIPISSLEGESSIQQ